MAFAAVSLRDRALILRTFQSGLKNYQIAEIRRFERTDGRVPIVVQVTPALKGRIPRAVREDVEYHTFLGSEACEALKLYLDNRRRAHGTIDRSSPYLSRNHSFQFY